MKLTVLVESIYRLFGFRKPDTPEIAAARKQWKEILATPESKRKPRRADPLLISELQKSLVPDDVQLSRLPSRQFIAKQREISEAAARRLKASMEGRGTEEYHKDGLI